MFFHAQNIFISAWNGTYLGAKKGVFLKYSFSDFNGF